MGKKNEPVEQTEVTKDLDGREEVSGEQGPAVFPIDDEPKNLDEALQDPVFPAGDYEKPTQDRTFRVEDPNNLQMEAVDAPELHVVGQERTAEDNSDLSEPASYENNQEEGTEEERKAA